MTRKVYSRSLSVVAGELDMKTDSGLEQKIQVIRIEIHPNYTGENNNFQNDLCILQLQEPISINSMISTISVAQNESQAETQCIISGWGSKQVCLFISWTDVEF